MAILGVLLGITMTVVAIAGYLAKRDRDFVLAQLNTLTERVIAVEKRKAQVRQEMSGTASDKPKVDGRTLGMGSRLRTWNEDQEAAS